MLSLRGVSYRYPGAKVESLHGIDLDLDVKYQRESTDAASTS